MTVSAEFSGVGGAHPASAVLAVAFFDGDREVDVGTVLIDGEMRFKRFQSIVSQKIGISPNQISMSLVRARKARSLPEIRRKTPIDEGSDFGAIVRERNCKVLAVLKRSRRSRVRRNRVDGRSGDGSVISKEAAIRVPEKTILRRPSPELMAIHGMAVGLTDYEALVNLQIQKERLAAAAKAASAPLYYPYAEKHAMENYWNAHAASPFYPYPQSPVAENRTEDSLLWLNDGSNGQASAAAAAVCEVCSSSDAGAFHFCVRDTITFGFRSNVGPIQRPAKMHVGVSTA